MTTNAVSMASAGRLGAAAGSTRNLEDKKDENKDKIGAHLKSDNCNNSNNAGTKEEPKDSVSISNVGQAQQTLSRTIERAVDDAKSKMSGQDVTDILKRTIGHMV